MEAHNGAPQAALRWIRSAYRPCLSRGVLFPRTPHPGHRVQPGAGPTHRSFDSVGLGQGLDARF